MNPDLNQDIQELQAQQGWSDETLGKLALNFIVEHGHQTEFYSFISETADEENDDDLIEDEKDFLEFTGLDAADRVLWEGAFIDYQKQILPLDEWWAVSQGKYV